MTTYPPNVLSPACPSRKVLEVLGNKWTLLVLVGISRGVNRHNQLLRGIRGISQKMLAQTLRQMERDGILIRVVHSMKPPMVEYEMTEMGAELINLVSVLGTWAEQHFEDIERARVEYDQRAS